jgi:glutamate synthase domain-containing protein 2/glutamate synthase domain-containing protein 3
MLVVDLVRGGVRFDDEIKHELSRSQPWAEWVSRHTRTIDPMLEHPSTSDAGQRAIRQNVFGFSSEEFKFILEPMGEGKDPVGSMGDDTPLAPLSAQARLLPGYFKQRFAQVTNPPIDPIREKMVMSLDVVLGGSGAWLIDSPAHADRVLLRGPILTAPELAAVSAQLPCETLACCFDAHGGAGALERALDALCAAAVAAVARGARVLVLSDLEVSAAHAPIPMLLAVGAVHHHLRREGKRYAVSLVAASGEPREVHHFAALIGYGASAIYPVGAYEAVTHDVGSADEAPLRLERYRATLSLGLLKVMSKMGISALSSYHGAQLFEALGLSGEVLTRCFTGTPSRLGGGLTFDDIAAEALTRHGRAYGHERPETLDDHGQYRFRQQGELHAWSPQMLRAVKDFRTSKAPKDYAAYRDASVNRAPIGLRDLLAFKVSETPVPLEEVEPASDIVRRFTTAAMSLGSLSPETHETLAVAMNRLGGKSNTGEGGEDRRHYKNTDPEYDAVAAIKQVASGRFGVTVEYLMHAVELEIKMAQGSKPGEGGQIPGDKVTPLIARLRRSTPGVPLISPPPHHDIYSIEDLAQLIYDLRQVNPKARVCVKLVSSAGVGTIAAGVAKAGADTILISGHEGGTGASPWSSIKNAGSPWELGLAEAQQTLVLNGLRERVLLRADGGLRTGRDVMVAALLGAEEYNFGTAALVALGCRYVRQCHSNTCPVGIATQRLSLRKKYDGTAEQLEAFLTAVAEELRELLASMGYRSLDEVIGRSELLVPATAQPAPAKAARLDLSGLMRTREEDETRISNPSWHNPIMPSLNDKIMRDLGDALEQERPTRLRYSIRNTDRTIGARVSGKIARLYGLEGLPASTVELDLDGSAGQSFGAFLANGVRLTLRGEANDYVAKGMSGGVIAISPRHEERRAGEILVGNTALYGATDGRVFIAGAAGERFAVRNSGATAVVEGVGAHGCEYMTGGAVMVLGETGDNFAAGMTGGAAYVWDPSGAIARRVAAGVVKLEPLTEERDVVFAHDLLHAHLQATNSPLARELMSRWEQTVAELWRLTPLALLDAVPMEDEDAPERVA